MSNSFTCTSDKPYDRHNYDVVLKSGQKKTFEYWEDAQHYWFSRFHMNDYLDYIVVNDKKKSNKKGFG